MVVSRRGAASAVFPGFPEGGPRSLIGVRMPAKAAKKSPASPSSRKAPRAVRAGTKAVAEVASGEKVPAKAQAEGGGGARGGRALVIVESPAKAKTINKFLGRKFMVRASMGHVRDLPKSKLGVDVKNDFKLTYQPLVDRKHVLDGLKELAKTATMVYLAPDPDREGEAIAWHLKEALELPAA